jgi:hypothetical protein
MHKTWVLVHPNANVTALPDDIINKHVTIKRLPILRWPCTEVDNAPTLEFFGFYQFFLHKVPLAVLINTEFIGQSIRGGTTKFQGRRRKDPTGDFHHLYIQRNPKMLSYVSPANKMVISTS